MRRVSGGTGAIVAAHLRELLEEWGLPADKVVFATMDSCSANVGCNKGAVVILAALTNSLK
jgi:hypothetical protein